MSKTLKIETNYSDAAVERATTETDGALSRIETGSDKPVWRTATMAEIIRMCPNGRLPWTADAVLRFTDGAWPLKQCFRMKRSLVERFGPMKYRTAGYAYPTDRFIGTNWVRLEITGGVLNTRVEANADDLPDAMSIIVTDFDPETPIEESFL